MYTIMPYQNADLQATMSTMWHTVPMAPQEPNLNLLLMMMQMLSNMNKFQYQPISTPNLQLPAELDIQSMVLSSQHRSYVMDELEKSQVPHEETREREVYEVLPSVEIEVQQENEKPSQDPEEKAALLKTTKELEDMVAENERIKKELEIAKEELENCRNNKEEEIKCNSIDNLHQVTVVSPIVGMHLALLTEGFRPGSKIVIRGRAQNGVDRLTFNFKYQEGTTAFHVDNIWTDLVPGEKLVMNSYINYSWGQKETVESAPIARGSDFIFSVQSEKEEFKICVNGSPFATYSHKFDPRLISAVEIFGAAEITSVYYHGIEDQESSADNDSSSSEELMQPLFHKFLRLPRIG